MRLVNRDAAVVIVLNRVAHVFATHAAYVAWRQRLGLDPMKLDGFDVVGVEMHGFEAEEPRDG